MSFQEQLKQIRELSGLNENVKSLLERMTGKELVSYEGIDALVAALMTFYNGELKKKAPSSHTHDDRYSTKSEINEKFKNFCPFPVNSLYLSLGNENPSSLWLGTTWQKQENRFLLGAGSSYGLGATGGSPAVTLSVENIPSHNHSASTTGHTHSQSVHNHSTTFGRWQRDESNPEALNAITFGCQTGKRLTSITDSAGGDTTGSASPITSIGYTGSNSAFSIMPPYIAINIWKRLS